MFRNYVVQELSILTPTHIGSDLQGFTEYLISLLISNYSSWSKVTRTPLVPTNVSLNQFTLFPDSYACHFLLLDI